MRSELAALIVVSDDARSKGYNDALRDVSAILDRYERDRQKRSARAITRRKSEGKKVGGDVPYGFELGPDGETLQESRAERRVIAAARALRAIDGDISLREIARRLKKQGMFPREFIRKTSTNDEFHAAQIQRMLPKDVK